MLLSMLSAALPDPVELVTALAKNKAMFPATSSVEQTANALEFRFEPTPPITTTTKKRKKEEKEEEEERRP